VDGLRPSFLKGEKMLVKEFIKMLQEFPSEEEIVALWFTKEEFEGVDEGEDIDEKVWQLVVAKAGRLDLDTEIIETVQSLVWDCERELQKNA